MIQLFNVRIFTEDPTRVLGATLREFWEQHTDAKRPLQAWLEEAKRAE